MVRNVLFMPHVKRCRCRPPEEDARERKAAKHARRAARTELKEQRKHTRIRYAQGSGTANDTTHQFHQLHDLKTHPDRTHRVQFCPAPPRCTTPSKRHHLVHGGVAHGGTMAADDVSDCLEDTRGVEEPVVDFLLNEIRVKKLSQKRDMGDVLLKLRVLWGRWEEQLRRTRVGRLWGLDDRYKDLK